MPFEYWTGIQIHLTFNVWTNKTLVFGWLRILGVRYSDHDCNFTFCFASQQLSNPSSCVICNLRNIVLKSKSQSRGSYPNKNVGKSRKKFATPGKQNLKKQVRNISNKTGYNLFQDLLNSGAFCCVRALRSVL